MKCKSDCPLQTNSNGILMVNVANYRQFLQEPHLYKKTTRGYFILLTNGTGIQRIQGIL